MSRFLSDYMSGQTLGVVRRRVPLALILVGACLSPIAAAAAESKSTTANLNVSQIIDRHFAARGGAQNWRAVQTLSVSGKIDAGTGDSIARSERVARGPSAKRAHLAALQKPVTQQQVQLPFRLEMKRPRKSRLEIDFGGATAVQVYDGQSGWKLRPYLNRNDIEPFSESEAKFEAEKADLGDPLLDYAAKGSQVSLEGVEAVDGHSAYKLKLTSQSGDVQHIWIDAQTFLDVKLEGIPRRMDGRVHSVWVYQRDFRSVHGLMVPYLYETAIEGGTDRHRMIVESVTVNPSLDDARFAKPQPPVAGSVPTTATLLPAALQGSTAK